MDITDEHKEFLLDSLASLTHKIDISKAISIVRSNNIFPDFERTAKQIVSAQKVGYIHDDNVKWALQFAGIIGTVNHYLDTRKEDFIFVETNEELEQIISSFFKPNPHKTELQTFQDEHNSQISDKRQQKALTIKEQTEKAKIKEKLLTRERKRELEKQAYNELIETGLIFNKRKKCEKSREPVPKNIANQVWNRDGGKCVQCGSQENLEFDHIIPFSKGGATSYRNLQLLCQQCNREKSDNIGD